MLSYAERKISDRLIVCEAEVARLRALLRWEGYSEEDIASADASPAQEPAWAAGAKAVVRKTHASIYQPAQAQSDAKPVAWWVHDFHIARQPVKAKGRFPAATEYLYPANREQDAKDTARTLGAECTPLYAHPPAQSREEGARGCR